MKTPQRLAERLFVLTLVAFNPAVARESHTGTRQTADFKVRTHENDLPLAAGLAWRPEFATALDTFVLARWDFDELGLPSADGWTGVDPSIDADTFFHVASALELDGGNYGGLIVLEGSKSLWCGAQASAADPAVCNYNSLPGYGSSWRQNFESTAFARTGDVTVSYIVKWDSESWYDRTTVYYEDENGLWANAGVGRGVGDFYDSTGFKRDSFTVADTALADSIWVLFRFTSDGAWDDRDGLHPTDGAVIIDSLVVSDASGVIDYQDFEAEADGALVTVDGRWRATIDEGYGDYAGLFSGLGLVQEDPCVYDISGVWAFFNGSTYDYSCGGHPEQAAVPFKRTIVLPTATKEVYLDNFVASPLVDWTSDIGGNPIPASASSAILEFDVYRDLPVDNLVFYKWNARGVVDGCIAEWPHNSIPLGYGDKKDWFRERVEFAELIPAGATEIQVMLGALDGCQFWCGTFGSGACHSHAPLFDNVRVVRVDQGGPAWDVNTAYFFQDNFAADGSTTGAVFIDAARKHPNTGGRADSAFVRVVAPGVGLDYHVPGDNLSGPAVYCHVGDVSPAKSGGAMSGDLGRWPVVTSGGGWTVFRCDYAREPFNPQSIERDWYCVDLNDNLFTPGDTIWYYFSARDQGGNTNYYSTLAGVSTGEAGVRAWPMEVTCLPANALSGATDILYVDDYDNHGAQPLFESAFALLGITPDRYDVLSPSSILGNGPGDRVVDVGQQIIGPYQKIIWNTGDLSAGLIGDGTGNPSTENDFALLYEFLDQRAESPGLYLSGDDIAEEWVTLAGTDAVNLRATYMNFDLISGDHVSVGEPVSPLVIGLAGGVFDHAAGPDTMIALGGQCASISDFDVLAATGPSQAAMAYSGTPARVAVVMQKTANTAGDTARVVLSGFSYHWIRDDRPRIPVDRADHLADIIRWLQNDVDPPTAATGGLVYAFSLSQNQPNPFNPTTTIAFGVARGGRVTLRVYDVAGRLIKTLVDDERIPGAYKSTWDGRNNDGRHVSSGVYFYRLVAGGETRVKKMVVLK